MISLFISILFSLLNLQPVQEEQNWKEIAKIEHQADFMTTDRLGNIYLSNENFIWLYNNQGDSIAAFNSRRFGKISYIDTTDPYKLLVFFSDYNLIVFLDNYLSENGEAIDLQELGFDQVSMACRSRNAGFWIYDQIKQKAIHLNENFEVDKQTVNLYQWFGKRIMPTSMLEYNNRLIINEKESGIYVFDHFGTFQKKLPITGMDNFQGFDRGITYFKAGNYCQYDFQKLDENCEKLKMQGVQNMRMEKNKIYVLQAKEAFIFATN